MLPLVRCISPRVLAIVMSLGSLMVVQTHSGAQKAVRPPVASTRPSIAKLFVEPSHLQLNGPRAKAHYLVTAQLANGTMQDVTDKVTRQVAQPTLAQFEKDATVLPLKEGVTSVSFEIGRAHV